MARRKKTSSSVSLRLLEIRVGIELSDPGKKREKAGALAGPEPAGTLQRADCPSGKDMPPI